MGILGRILGFLIPVVITLVIILFLYGYLSPIGLSPTAIFGSSYASLFGGTLTGGATPGTGSILTGTYSPLLPSGLVGLAIFQMIHRRVSSMTRSMTAPRRSSPDEMMRKMNLQNIMPGMMMGTGAAAAAASVARELPSDITKPQFTLLNSYKQGHKNPKEVAKALSMDKKEVERMTNSLVSSGYLTKENKLTEKSLGLYA